MVTTRPPKTIVKPTALGPVANTDTKLLIYGLFQKGRVLAQDGDAYTSPTVNSASTIRNARGTPVLSSFVFFGHDALQSELRCTTCPRTARASAKRVATWPAAEARAFRVCPWSSVRRWRWLIAARNVRHYVDSMLIGRKGCGGCTSATSFAPNWCPQHSTWP